MRDFTDDFNSGDIALNKGPALLSYIGFLFIIPLLIRKNSLYTRFHVNQGLVLFVVAMLLQLVQRGFQWIFGSFIFVLVMVVINFVFAVLHILILTMIVFGVYNVVCGRARELPLIGRIRFLR